MSFAGGLLLALVVLDQESHMKWLFWILLIIAICGILLHFEIKKRNKSITNFHRSPSEDLRPGGDSVRYLHKDLHDQFLLHRRKGKGSVVYINGAYLQIVQPTREVLEAAYKKASGSLLRGEEYIPRPGMRKNLLAANQKMIDEARRRN